MSFRLKRFPYLFVLNQFFHTVFLYNTPFKNNQVRLLRVLDQPGNYFIKTAYLGIQTWKTYTCDINIWESIKLWWMRILIWFTKRLPGLVKTGKTGFKKWFHIKIGCTGIVKKTFSFTQVYLLMQSVVYIAYVSFVCTWTNVRSVLQSCGIRNTEYVVVYRTNSRVRYVSISSLRYIVP